MKTSAPGTCASPARGSLLSQSGRIAVLLFCACCALEEIAEAAVEVIAQRIEETRALVFKDDKISRSPAALKLVLALDGAEAESATQYGRVGIEEAADNTRASLILRADSFHSPAKFRDYENAFFRHSKFGGKSESVKPQVELDLALPARDAGKTNTVELADLKHAGKKAVPLPNGSPVGLLIVVPSDDNVRSISVESTGDDNALASLEVVDASGKRISNGMSSWSFNGGPAQKSLGLAKPLDDSMKLVVKIVSDRKFTKVPFYLKDVPLP